MNQLIVKNKDLLSILNEFLYFYENRDLLKNGKLQNEHIKKEDVINDERYRKVLEKGSNHDGFPEILKGYIISDIRQLMPRDSYTDETREPVSQDFIKKASEINEKMMNFLSARMPGVSTIYPPGGFISWHNNANAFGYNFIFTWSETGDGAFYYVDPDTGEKVTMQDSKQQWMCKYTNFGSYDNKEHLIYHAAETNCWRMTFAYVMDNSKESEQLQKMLIEEMLEE